MQGYCTPNHEGTATMLVMFCNAVLQVLLSQMSMDFDVTITELHGEKRFIQEDYLFPGKLEKISAPSLALLLVHSLSVTFDPGQICKEKGTASGIHEGD